jgi:hypothetical protein
MVGEARNVLADAVLRETAQRAFSVTAVERLVHPPHDIHVLLRHRLLPQPGVFEGFVPVGVHHLIPDVEDLLDIERPVFEAPDPLCEPLVDSSTPTKFPGRIAPGNFVMDKTMLGWTASGRTSPVLSKYSKARRLRSRFSCDIAHAVSRAESC